MYTTLLFMDCLVNLGKVSKAKETASCAYVFPVSITTYSMVLVHLQYTSSISAYSTLLYKIVHQLSSRLQIKVNI